MLVQGSVCIVTGGGAGLGLGTARVLREGGAKVAVFDVRPPPDDALASGVVYHRVDITDENAVQAAIDAVVAEFGALHVCVNCAGIVQSAPLLGPDGPFPIALFRRTVDVNLTGTFIVMSLAAVAMARNEGQGADGERGVIVNTASIAAFDASSNVAYAASKGGVVSLNLSSARQLAEYGIRINAIAPGYMDTEMLASLPPEWVTRLLTTTVYPKRLGVPAEFGRLVCQIVETPFLNAATIRFDGGARV